MKYIGRKGIVRLNIEANSIEEAYNIVGTKTIELFELPTEENKMIHLSFNYIGAYYENDKRHAVDAINDLGIIYEYSIPQSIGDCYQFYNCINVPNELPEYIEIKKLKYKQ